MTTMIEVMEESRGKQSEATLTRREFMSYAWGAALGTLTLEMGLGWL